MPAQTLCIVTFLSKPPTTTMLPEDVRAQQRTRAVRGILHSVAPDTVSKTVMSWSPATAILPSCEKATPPCCAGHSSHNKGSNTTPGHSTTFSAWRAALFPPPAPPGIGCSLAQSAAIAVRCSAVIESCRMRSRRVFPKAA